MKQMKLSLIFLILTLSNSILCDGYDLIRETIKLFEFLAGVSDIPGRGETRRRAYFSRIDIDDPKNYTGGFYIYESDKFNNGSDHQIVFYIYDEQKFGSAGRRLSFFLSKNNHSLANKTMVVNGIHKRFFLFKYRKENEEVGQYEIQFKNIDETAELVDQLNGINLKILDGEDRGIAYRIDHVNSKAYSWILRLLFYFSNLIFLFIAVITLLTRKDEDLDDESVVSSVLFVLVCVSSIKMAINHYYVILFILWAILVIPGLIWSLFMISEEERKIFNPIRIIYCILSVGLTVAIFFDESYFIYIIFAFIFGYTVDLMTDFDDVKDDWKFQLFFGIGFVCYTMFSIYNQANAQLTGVDYGEMFLFLSISLGLMALNSFIVNFVNYLKNKKKKDPKERAKGNYVELS